MLNNVSVQGRFTADPELKTTQSGKSVVSFTLANDQNFKDNAVNWLDCVAWGKTAEFIEKYFKKGSQAIIQGALQTRQYENKDGNKIKVTEINVQNCYFCEKKIENPKQTQPQSYGGIDIDEDDSSNGFVVTYDSDELPF